MSKVDMLAPVVRALVGVPQEYLGVTLDFANKLGGKDGAQWKARFAGVLREGILSVVSSPSSFPIWKTLTIGTGLADANAFRTAHKRANFCVGNNADQLLGKITIAKEPSVLDLVRVSVAELGFKYGANWQDLILRAQELGLSLCQPEVGPHLRLSYSDQPLGEWLAVAMEPNVVSDDHLRVFVVQCSGGGLWLSTYWSDSSRFWSPGRQLVFVRR